MTTKEIQKLIEMSAKKDLLQQKEKEERILYHVVEATACLAVFVGAMAVFIFVGNAVGLN